MAKSSLCGIDVGRYLLLQGHRHVAYLDFAPAASWSVERLKGLRQSFKMCGVADGVSEILLGKQTPIEIFRPYNPDKLAPPDLAPREHEVIIRALRPFETVINTSVKHEKDRANVRDRIEKLVNNKTITAWVGANDSIAIFCLEFLRERGVRIPEGPLCDRLR